MIRYTFSQILVGLVVAVVLVAGVRSSQAETVFDPAGDPDLHDQMLKHDRMFHLLHAYPFGVGLTGGYPDEAALGLIEQFLEQDSDDIEGAIGKHPYELFSNYEGPAGIGLRGGGAVIATAFKYMALKAEGAPEEELAPVRLHIERLLHYMWVIHAITGIPHGIARGAMLMHSEEGEPPLPHNVPELVPLFNEDGEPFEEEKTNGTDRADNSGGVLPEGKWYWVDSCSKDQLVGWVAAMATLYDASKDDPNIDQALVVQLEEVAQAIGEGFRIKYPIEAMDGKTYDYDMCLMDADGRFTQHHDLHPLSIEKAYMPPESQVYNVFNLIMGLGIIKGLYHVSGDPEAEQFLYEELLQNRGWLEWVPTDEPSELGMDYLFMGTNTNHSNVNMAAIALFLNIYFEKDPTVLERMRGYMEHQWWDVTDTPESVRFLKQPYFHAFYEAMTTHGSDPERTEEVASLLKAFPLAPYTSEERINCDEAELEAGVCLGVDGETEIILKGSDSWGDKPVAAEALDPSIRPPSNFNARSNPFQVNGGGGQGLMPGGDLLSAYWLLRYLPTRVAGDAAMSPNARDHVWLREPPLNPEPDVELGPEPVEDVVELVETDTAEDTGSTPDVVTEEDSGSSGGCSTNGSGPVPLLPTLLVILLMALRFTTPLCKRD